MLEAQRQFFVSLRAEVEKRKGLAPDRVQAEVPAIRTALIARHPTYIEAGDKAIGSFESQFAQVYKEITGKDFPKKAALEDARRAHDRHHGIAPAE